MDVFLVFSLIEPPLLHLPYPSVDDAKKEIAACHDGTLAARALSAHLAIHAGAAAEIGGGDAAERDGALRLRVPVIPAGQRVGHGGGQRGRQDRRRSPRNIWSAATAAPARCASSSASSSHGEGNILQLRQALFRCDELFERIAIGKGRHYHVVDNQATQLIVQDSTRHFTLHSVVENDEDMAAKFEQTVAMPVKYEMLYVGEWRQNLLVADRFMDRRVLLAGDAVHLMIPTGGLGMNTGVGDAIDLGWKLAGTLQGWGGPGLLASYEAERRPTGDAQCRRLALRFARAAQMALAMAAEHPRQHAGGRGGPRPSRRGRRRRAAQDQRDDRRRARLSLCRLAADRDEPGEPPYDYIEYRPSTFPGVRLPHAWLDDGRAAQDCIGDGYTLLRLGEQQGRRVGVGARVRQASARRSRCST